jgi:hypothetical protein|tara:strand:+ start:37 stop:510 length:474 start_codon:yes stop_codon:yes gene_type:complete
MKVIDNFLDQDSFNHFKNIITGQYFPWYFNNQKVLEDNHLDNYQFVNTFKDGNTAMPLLDVFKEKLNVSNFLRAKLNCTTRTNKIFEFKSHRDLDVNCLVSIFYINSNNGYTKFENGQKIESIENRLITFNNNLKHNGTTSTNSQTRIVLNLCYEKN